MLGVLLGDQFAPEEGGEGTIFIGRDPTAFPLVAANVRGDPMYDHWALYDGTLEREMAFYGLGRPTQRDGEAVLQRILTFLYNICRPRLRLPFSLLCNNFRYSYSTGRTSRPYRIELACHALDPDAALPMMDMDIQDRKKHFSLPFPVDVTVEHSILLLLSVAVGNPHHRYHRVADSPHRNWNHRWSVYATGTKLRVLTLGQSPLERQNPPRWSLGQIGDMRQENWETDSYLECTSYRADDPFRITEIQAPASLAGLSVKQHEEYDRWLTARLTVGPTTCGVPGCS